MSRILELKQRRHDIVVRMGALLQGAETKEKVTEWEKLNVEQKNVAAQIQTLELEQEMRGVPRDPQRPNIGGEITQSHRSEQRRSPEYRALDRFIRNGDVAELRTYSPLAADGSLVPTTLFNEVDIFKKYFGGMTSICRTVVTDTGAPLDWSLMDDTANAGTWLGENQGPANQVNPTFDKRTLNGHLCATGPVLTSLAQVQDSKFDLWGELLAPAFAIRLQRTANFAYTRGDGSTQPITGLIPTVAAFGSGSQIVTAAGAFSNSDNEADTDLNSVGTDDFDNLISKVDVAYRTGPNVGFQMNQLTMDKLRMMKDKFGRPIWQTNLSDGQPDKIRNYPVVINNDLDAIGASHNSVVFGDFSQFIVRLVRGVVLQRLDQLYATTFQFGFQAAMRTDAATLNPKAFAILQHPAS